MRILTVSSVFPPRVIGGAELCASYLAQWLTARGHQVGVLTVADLDETELQGDVSNGLQIWRQRLPRTHTQHRHKAQSAFGKLRWHIQDHLDPRNGELLAQTVREFQPDVILLQVVQGLGHNALSVLARYPDIPVFYFLHDLTLACFRTSMHKPQGNCQRQCLECGISSKQKMRFIRGRRNLHFVSPSAANMKTLDALLDLSEFPKHVIPNLDLDEPVPHQPRIEGEPPRFLYVGRLDPIKGVNFALDVLSDLADKGHAFSCMIIGSGPQEAALKSQYGQQPWLTFTGKIPHEEVKRHISRSDLLLLPSLWRENHPGVVRQALRAGVPVAASDIGGSKEMLRDRESGLVLTTGSHSAWAAALKRCVVDADYLARLQEGARAHGAEYSADEIGMHIESLLNRAIYSPTDARRDNAILNHFPPGSTCSTTLDGGLPTSLRLVAR